MRTEKTAKPIPLNLSRLFAPRSIAVVGASESQNSVGGRVLKTLRGLGFSGDVYPVNPKHDSVAGWRCYPDFASLPAGVDAVAFCVQRDVVLEQFPLAAARGIGAAVIYATGFADAGPEGMQCELAIKRVAAQHGVAVVGPNGMGVLSPATNSSLYSGTLLDPTRLRGNVGIVTQSGAIAVGLLTDCRRYGFSHVVSSGNEAVVQMPDCIDYLVGDNQTRVIALFVESVRDVEHFKRSLDHAAAADKPVVVLKVGQCARAQQAALGHTGAVTGDGRAFSALLARHRAIEVCEPDELVEVLAACQSSRLPTGPRIGLISASGGQVELIHDVVHRCGYVLPPLASLTRERLHTEAGIETRDGNPLDAWGDGNWRRNLPLALELMDADPNLDNVLFTSDTFDQQPMVPTSYAPMVLAAAARSSKPHYFFNTRPGIFRQENADAFAGSGTAVIGGIRQGLGAVHRLGTWAMTTTRPAARARLASLPDIAPMCADGRDSINEYDAKKLLAEAGLPIVAEVLFEHRGEMDIAAEQLGFPLVLKVVSDAIAHRSENGLVQTGLADHATLAVAFEGMARRLEQMTLASPARFLLQQQIGSAVEVFAGISVDVELGPCLLVGSGGVLVELVADTAVRPLPLREGDVEEMLKATRLGKLLAGFRGQPAADHAALVECLYRLGELGIGWAPQIREMDVNPILVLPAGQGCVVVDAVIFPKASCENTSAFKNQIDAPDCR